MTGLLKFHYCILLAYLLVVFCIDIRKSVIPNRLTFGGMIAGLLYHLIAAGPQGFLYSLSGLAAGFGIFLFLYLFGGVGAGDVKLFGAVGAMSGLHFVLQCMAYTILYAGAIGIVMLLWNKNLVTRLYRTLLLFFFFIFRRDISDFEIFRKKSAVRFPLMYAVLPGAITALFFV